MDAQPLFATTAVAASGGRISQSTVESAVNALLKYKAKQAASQKPQLLPQDDYVYLNVTLKKIPTNPPTAPFKIRIPHPLLDPTSELCLIIDDRPHSPTPPSEDIKKLIKSQNIPISKVLKISKLKTNYKPFEAKRKLCDSYDLFLVDKRVVHLLPKLLGKQFFHKKKLPLGVDLSKKNLKAQVEKALGSALLYLRTGTCCVIRVGKVAMEKDEIVENIVSVVEDAAEIVPKKWNGVRSLHLKFSDSVALPIYQALPDMKLKIDGTIESKKGVEEVRMDNDNENEEKEVSGRKNAESAQKKKKKKGRIHEVQYMDVGDEDEVEAEGTMNEDEDEYKGKEEDLMENNSEDEDLVADGRKKRKAQKKKKKKGRIHEVQYMDVGDEDEVEAEGTMNEDEDEYKGKEEDLMENNSEHEDLVADGRKKRKAVKAKNIIEKNEEKETKKKRKMNEGDEKLKNEGLSKGKKGLKKTENKKEANKAVTKTKDTNSKKRVSTK